MNCYCLTFSLFENQILVSLRIKLFHKDNLYLLSQMTNDVKLLIHRVKKTYILSHNIYCVLILSQS